jgi:hypothetical protein
MNIKSGQLWSLLIIIRALLLVKYKCGPVVGSTLIYSTASSLPKCRDGQQQQPLTSFIFRILGFHLSSVRLLKDLHFSFLRFVIIDHDDQCSGIIMFLSSMIIITCNFAVSIV